MTKNILLLVMALLSLSSVDAFQGTTLTTTIDNFERDNLVSGVDVNGVPVGDLGFTGVGANLFTGLTDAPPTQVPAAVADNKVLSLNMTVPSNNFAVYVQNFTNAAVDEWVFKDWSNEEGISLWVYGNNTGGNLFFDILDNRNPGSTSDDAERFTVVFTDNFSGWQFFEFPWNDFSRKEVANGAPDDGLNLTEIYGFAFGVEVTSSFIDNATFFIDDVSTYRIEETPAEPLPVMGNFALIFLILLLGILGSVAMMKEDFTNITS
jgi:hypothetical protein